ncbi:hypothetical protein LguiB_026199 [Lonicera macranthoides]
MALLSPLLKSPKLPVLFHKNFSIPIHIVLEAPNSAIFASKKSKISIPTASNLLNPTHQSQRLHCYSASNSSVESDESPNIVLIKGLPQSTSEKGLKTAFSQFGEVSQVKIVTDKKTTQSLGFAYIWFTSKASVRVAVKEMDGKFFNGRFICVSIARPGSCKPQVEAKQYKG